jgi:lambda family phage portal protein
MGNWLDKLKRGAMGIMGISGPYKGGEINRLNKKWQPDNWSGDSAIAEDWELLTRRIRDLERNDPAIIALKRALLDHVIGVGLATTAAVMIGQELAEDFNSESDDSFDYWAENEADVFGRLAWPDMQRQIFSEMADTGEALLLRCQDANPDRLVPLCYQVLEAEQLDVGRDRPAGRGQTEIKRGIEFDRVGRPIAYWLHDVHPDDPNRGGLNDSKRIPASRIHHPMLAGRPSASRGISLYSAITQTAKDLDNYLGAELTAANIGALFSVIHKTATPGGGMGFSGDGSTADGTDDNDNPIVKLGRGIVSQIGQDDSIEQVDPNRPNAQAKTFCDLILMLTGMGGNVSKYRLTRDYTGTTYVAARAAHLDDRAAFRPMQGLFGRSVCLPVRREWTAQMAAHKQFASLSLSQFSAQRRRWQRVELQTPGWEQIDPEKETDADIAALGAGLTTLKDVIARRSGKNWRSVILQREREIKFAAEHGVEMNLQRPSTPGNSEAKKEEAPADA